jgi:hypothetical protein
MSYFPPPPRINYVEDALAHLSSRLMFDKKAQDAVPDLWFRNFIENVSRWSGQDKPLTTEQAKIVLKLLAKTRAYFISEGVPAENIDDLMANPQYRNQPTLSAVIPREVRWAGDNILAFRFKRNDIILNDLKAITQINPLVEPIWDTFWRLWTIPVFVNTVDATIGVIGKHRFGLDDDVELFLARVADEAGIGSAFVLDNDRVIYEINDQPLLRAWVEGPLGGTGGAIPATPSVARRLLRLPEAMQNVAVDPALAEIASQGLIAPAAMEELDEPHQALAQDIYDLDLRCGVEMSNREAWVLRQGWVNALGVAAKARGLTNVVLQKDRAAYTPQLLVSLKRWFPELHQVRDASAIPDELFKQRDSTLILIVDQTDTHTEHMPGLFAQFYHCVMFSSPRKVRQFPMFSNMPAPTNVIGKNTETAMLAQGLSPSLKRCDFLFNLSTALV